MTNVCECSQSGEVVLNPPEYRCSLNSNGGSLRVEIASPYRVRLEVRYCKEGECIRIAPVRADCGQNASTYHACNYELPKAGDYEVVVLNDDPTQEAPYTIDLIVC